MSDMVIQGISRLDFDLPLNEHDFDGHTAFQTLTYTQKLSWLSDLAASLYLMARCNPQSGCNLLFQKRGVVRSRPGTEIDHGPL